MAKLVYIAAGHGGPDNGAGSGAFVEDSLNLKVAKYAQKYLSNFVCSVRMSRTTDNGDNTIDKRCAQAKKLGANCFVEIHHNAGGGDGYEVYYWDDDLSAKKLAECVSKQFSALKQNPHGTPIKESELNTKYNFGVCRKNSNNGIPAVIGEYAYVDNPVDRTIIDTEAELKSEGEAYAKAAIAFLGLEKKPAEKIYTVVKGDTLWGIATKNLKKGATAAEIKAKITEIKNLNGLKSDVIKIGMKLRIRIQ